MRRLCRLLPYVFIALVCACASAPQSANSPIPDESRLRARVAELYRASDANDDQAIRALILPQIISCEMISPPDEPHDDRPTLEIIKWNIQSIAFDMHYFDDLDELCPGQPVHATAGAMVTIWQTDRKVGEEVSSGELYQPWLYVDGTWYFLVDVD